MTDRLSPYVLWITNVVLTYIHDRSCGEFARIIYLQPVSKDDGGQVAETREQAKADECDLPTAEVELVDRNCKEGRISGELSGTL